MIPDSLGGDRIIDLLPVDILSGVILDESLQFPKLGNGAKVYQPMNRNRTSWTSLLPSIIKAMNDTPKATADAISVPMIIVKPSEWLARLRQSTAEMGSKKDIRVNPALKLIDFFAARFGDQRAEARLVWMTDRAMGVRQSLRSASEVDGELMMRWVRSWYEIVEN